MNNYVGKKVTIIKNQKQGVIIWIHPKYRFVSVQLANYVEDFYPNEII